MFFKLEMRLALKEEQLLEKGLVHEQIDRLSGKLKVCVENGKGDTLTLAKKVIEIMINNDKL